MGMPSDENWEVLQEQIIGLGKHSARKSYYPELQLRIRELEETRSMLAMTNQRLQAVMDAASEIAIIATDTDGLITVFNHGAEKMLGYRAKEMIGKQTPMIFHLISDVDKRAQFFSEELGESISGFQVLIENVRRLGVETQELTFVRKDGAMLLVRLIITAIRDKQGVIGGYLGIAEDITRKKAMENKIIENEKLLDTIINSIPTPIFYKDPNGVYTGCNTAFCSYLGLSRERIIGSTVFDLAPSDLAKVYHQADLELMARSGTQTYEANVAFADGTRHEVIFYKSCIQDSDGEALGLVGVMLDISDRKRVERELMQKEELFHLLFEKSGDANLLIDGETIVDCNAATLKMLGYDDKKQVVSLNPADLSPEYQPDGRVSAEKVSEVIRLAYEQGNHRFEWLHKRVDGSDLPVEVMLTAIPMGERWFIHTAWRDLTDRKLAEAENERLTQKLLHGQKMEAIGTLAGGIAHDFNNILGGILGYAELARNASPSGSKAIAYLDKELEAIHRASALVKQILAFSRRTDSERIPLQLTNIIKEAINLLRPTLPSTITIKQHLDTTWPILADPNQIHQIMINFCTNAFHAMEQTGGILNVSLKNSELSQKDLPPQSNITPGKFVELFIGDSGSGIPSDLIAKIFEPYFTTKETGKGTGMGLAIVHGIVKKYGGFINVESERGIGTVFHVFFPAIEEEFSPEIMVEHTIPVGGESILLIDDEDILVETGKAMLEELGYKVAIRTSSIDALELFRNHPDRFDLVITDQTMPGITGIELAQQILKIRHDIPIILCTGFSNMISEERARIYGIKGFAMKPLAKKDLAALIRKVLDGEK